MSTNSKSLLEAVMPQVDPDSVELESPDHASLHTDLNSIAIGMGFYSHGCDTEFSMMSAYGDFRTALLGARY